MENIKLNRAKSVLQSLIEKKNPYTMSLIDGDELMTDERLIRLFEYLNEILHDYAKMSRSIEYKGRTFIFDDELEMIQLPNYDIGISEFCQSVNQVVDDSIRKKISVVNFNNSLRKLGIIRDDIKEGAKVTRITEFGMSVGLYEIESTSSKGEKYLKVMYNDQGKKFLLSHLKEIVNIVE
ncbi:MAG: hypothetical protein JXR88_18175 [Clostridia bacterium]|nr:hypothetical protein [Clostridia bacterium]